jgi:hypothetical protein
LLVGLVFPPGGEALAVLAGEINGLTIAIVHRVAGLDRAPSWLMLDFERLPIVFLIAIGVVAMVLVSAEVRRWLGDLSIRIQEREAAIVPLGAGVMIGMVLGIAAIVIMI